MKFVDEIAFKIMQIIALITAVVLQYVSKYIQDPDTNFKVEGMAYSNWFLFYSELEDLPFEMRSQILLVGRLLLGIIIIQVVF